MPNEYRYQSIHAPPEECATQNCENYEIAYDQRVVVGPMTDLQKHPIVHVHGETTTTYPMLVTPWTQKFECCFPSVDGTRNEPPFFKVGVDDETQAIILALRIEFYILSETLPFDASYIFVHFANPNYPSFTDVTDDSSTMSWARIIDDKLMKCGEIRLQLIPTHWNEPHVDQSHLYFYVSSAQYRAVNNGADVAFPIQTYGIPIEKRL